MINRTAFTQGDVKALETICNIGGSALASALLHRELQQAHQKVEVALHDLQKAQSKIIEQERLHALGQMARGIAHDFNNALGPVLGYTELQLMNPANSLPFSSLTRSTPCRTEARSHRPRRMWQKEGVTRLLAKPPTLASVRHALGQVATAP